MLTTLKFCSMIELNKKEKKMDEQSFPNLTLEKAKEMIGKLQARHDDAVHQKVLAQSIAFKLQFPDPKLNTIDYLSADNIYLREELKKVIEKRDRCKKELEEMKAENNLLKIQLKNKTKDKEREKRNENNL